MADEAAQLKEKGNQEVKAQNLRPARGAGPVGRLLWCCDGTMVEVKSEGTK